MLHELPARLSYAERFRCIGAACEDTCCSGWTVPVDRAARERFKGLPEGPLKILLSVNLEPVATDSHQDVGSFRMTDKHQCPLLTEERLCRIHSELGEGMLPQTCASFPRFDGSMDGVVESSLALSCPEAARLVLLSPDLAAFEQVEPSAGEAAQLFWAIRATVLTLVRNREYPLWQRLFLLNIFCQRLDSIARGTLRRSMTEFLADFDAAVAGGTLRGAMEALPVDRNAQLDVVLRLAGLMLHKSNIRPRFVECVQAFTTGIGNGPGATLDSLGAHYARAHDRYFAPFFDRHPHILENYLINSIVQRRFPFGKGELGAGAEPLMVREFALLAAQFALMRGLLIGVAGFQGAAFCAAHVVHTVQAASKHFEHHPKFLAMAHALLVESRMDGARGLAILLRNAEADGPEMRPSLDKAVGEAMPAFAGISATGMQDGRPAWAPDQGGTAHPG